MHTFNNNDFEISFSFGSKDDDHGLFKENQMLRDYQKNVIQTYGQAIRDNVLTGTERGDIIASIKLAIKKFILFYIHMNQKVVGGKIFSSENPEVINFTFKTQTVIKITNDTIDITGTLLNNDIENNKDTFKLLKNILFEFEKMQDYTKEILLDSKLDTNEIDNYKKMLIEKTYSLILLLHDIEHPG